MSPILVVALLIFVPLNAAGLYFVFEKAGEPGWQALVPLWHIHVLRNIVGGSPGVYFFPSFMAQDLARSFGKGFWFAAGLWILPFIFVPILGFGGAVYEGPSPSGPGWGEEFLI